MKIYNGKPGGRGVIHDEGRVIPALRQLDDFEMFVVGGSEPLEYVLAAQPYTLAAAAVDDLCRQVAPLGLEVAVYRHAAWRHQLATLVLIARRGVLKDVWQSE